MLGRADHGVKEADGLLPGMPVHAGVDQAAVLIALELEDGVVHQAAVEQAQTDQQFEI